MARVAYDVECYKNYFLIMSKDHDTGEIKEWRTHNGKRRGLNPQDFLELTKGRTMIGFNSFGYDIPMCCGYLSGFSHDELYDLSQYLVNGDQLTPWQVWNHWPNLQKFEWSDVDVMQIAPGVASLKMYAGRMGFKKLQDLPIHWESLISEKDHETMRPYCINDVEATLAIYDKVRPQVRLRHTLSKKYRVNLLSKSDPSIAESVLQHELKAAGCHVTKGHSVDSQYMYSAPDYLKFTSPGLQTYLDIATLTPFKLDNANKFKIPASLKDPIRYKGAKYKLGVGGLHSQEKHRCVVAEEGFRLCEVDVASYYPWMIINEGYAPAQYGESFTEVYTAIVKDRMRAKADGDTVTADSLKIVINSSFGKFGNRYSSIFSPSLLIHTTLTGQFLLLKLIEMMEMSGVKVVSANTDGIVCKYADESRASFDLVISKWQKLTDLILEETEYSGLYSESVNSYLAVKPDGTYKGKAAFASAGLSKNPQAPIVAHAVAEHIAGRGHYIHTLKQCTDVSQFCYLRRVTGGCEYDMEEVGKTVRWYIGINFRLPFCYITSGNNVPNSMNGVLCNLLPEEFPEDINYAYYIKEARDLFESIGVKI